MGKQYKKLTQEDMAFIKEQKLFYIASCSGGEVNLSPKGYDSIRVLNANSLLFMQYPGSGNRTYRDVANGGEVTLVFNAFNGDAKILRLFCKAEIVDKYYFLRVFIITSYNLFIKKKRFSHEKNYTRFSCCT